MYLKSDVSLSCRRTVSFGWEASSTPTDCSRSSSGTHKNMVQPMFSARKLAENTRNRQLGDAKHCTWYSDVSSMVTSSIGWLPLTII